MPSSSSLPEQQQAQQVQDSSQPAAVAPPVKRVGFSLDLGPGDAARQQNFTGVSRRKQEQLQREQQAEAKQRNKYDEKLVDALVDVPELEEEGKEDITRIVAQAPKSSAPQFQRISELEFDQAWAPNQAARSTVINLSLLTSCLLPSAQVVEPPEVWDYSLLFSQLKAELQNEAAAPADSSTNGANPQDDPVPA